MKANFFGSFTTPHDVATERDKMLQSDLLIVHFPLWWFGMPAILKGWIDRVFIYGSVYRSQMRFDTGICKGKKMLAFIATGATQDSCSFIGREGDTRLHAWPILYPFRYIGFDVSEPTVFHGVGGVAFIEEQKDGLSGIDRYINQWGDALNRLGKRKITPLIKIVILMRAKDLYPMRLLIPLLFLINQIHHGIDLCCTSPNEVGRRTGIGVGGATKIKISTLQ